MPNLQPTKYNKIAHDLFNSGGSVRTPPPKFLFICNFRIKNLMHYVVPDFIECDPKHSIDFINDITMYL